MSWIRDSPHRYSVNIQVFNNYFPYIPIQKVPQITIELTGNLEEWVWNVWLLLLLDSEWKLDLILRFGMELLPLVVLILIVESNPPLMLEASGSGGDLYGGGCWKPESVVAPGKLLWLEMRPKDEDDEGSGYKSVPLRWGFSSVIHKILKRFKKDAYRIDTLHTSYRIHIIMLFISITSMALGLRKNTIRWCILHVNHYTLNSGLRHVMQGFLIGLQLKIHLMIYDSSESESKESSQSL